MKRVLCIAGTRSEAVKVAPVYHELRKDKTRFSVELCSTGQQRELLDQIFADLKLAPHHQLGVMRRDQTLGGLTADLLTSLTSLFAQVRPDWVITQGATASAMSAAWAAFYQRIRVAHLEAGLRSSDRANPFPEEANRRAISLVADLHFAPTEAAKAQLIREGVAAERIQVTGNTGVDALLAMREQIRTNPPRLPEGIEQAIRFKKRILLLTAHRRESQGAGLEGICKAVRLLTERHRDVICVAPVHPNPKVREVFQRMLSGNPAVILADPLGYRAFVRLMESSHLILTDSGGVQDEAPSVGKPVLVLREASDRPEGQQAGVSRLVGTDKERVFQVADLLLSSSDEYARSIPSANPYGDGRAAPKIAAALANSLPTQDA